jgi:hypothetical protein
VSDHQAAANTIELLYFEGCPNHETLLAHLPALLEREGITAEIVFREIRDTDEAVRERFLGSPTLRVNGRDIEPNTDQRSDYGLRCRIYQTPTGLTGVPPDELLLDALAQRPDPPASANNDAHGPQ